MKCNDPTDAHEKRGRLNFMTLATPASALNIAGDDGVIKSDSNLCSRENIFNKRKAFCCEFAVIINNESRVSSIEAVYLCSRS